MLSRSDFLNAALAELSAYPDLAQRYAAGDPTLTVQSGSIADFLSLLSSDIQTWALEPFLKTMDRTVLADATVKGILPLARPTQYTITVTNAGTSPVPLSAGRVVLDGQGRPWQLLSAVTVPAASTGTSGFALGSATVNAEQSQISNQSYTVPIGEPLHTVKIPTGVGLSFCAIPSVMDSSGNTWTYSPFWMNVAVGDLAYTALTNTARAMMVQFGMANTVGTQVNAGDQFTFTLTQTYGALDTTRLSVATLSSIGNTAERQLSFSFTGTGSALLQAGSNVLDIAHLRLLSTYPALYNENAVYLGNFDFLVRRYYGMRCGFLSVWNEAVQEKAFGSGTLNVNFINNLFVSVVPIAGVDLTTLFNEIALKIGAADSLYSGRVNLVSNTELEYPLQISGSIASVYNIDQVESQIQTLLLATYGQGQVAVSKPLPNGFNLSAIVDLIKDNVSAFQDPLSDISIQIVGSPQILPNTWAYLTTNSLTFNITRNADDGGGAWNQ